jgi:hypothetical protein
MRDEDPNGRFVAREIGVVLRKLERHGDRYRPRWYPMVGGREVGNPNGYATRKAANEVAQQVARVENSKALAKGGIPVGFDPFEAF